MSNLYHEVITENVNSRFLILPKTYTIVPNSLFKLMNSLVTCIASIVSQHTTQQQGPIS